MTEEDLRREFEFEEQLKKEKLAGERKAIVSGAVTGLVGSTVGTPGDVAEIVEAGRKKVGIPRSFINLPLFNRPPIAAMLPSTEGILKSVDEAAGTELGYEPQNPTEKYEKSITAGAVGNLLPGGRVKTGARLLVGGLAGGAGEAVDQATGNPLLGALTNIATLLGFGHAASTKPQSVKAAQKDLATIPEEKLRAGDTEAGEIEQATGVRPLLSQTLDDPTALSGITQEVARSQHGQLLQKVLGKEMSVGQEKIDQLVAGLSQRPLGQRTANEVLTAGEKALERPGKVASASAKRDYARGKRDTLPVADGEVVNAQTGEKVGNVYDASPVEGNRTDWKVQKTTIQELKKRLYARAEELSLDGGSKAGKPFYDAVERLVNLENKYPDGVPFGHLDVLQREAAKTAELASAPGAKRGVVLGKEANQSVAGIINDVLKEGSDALAEGKGKFSRWMKGYGDLVNKSPLPDMFTEGARQAGRGDWDQMTVVLKNSEKYTPQDVAFVAKNLRRADPEAFPALVKQAWSTALENSRAPTAGRTPQSVMNDWVREVAGDSGSKARQNALEAIRQIAETRGQDPQLAATAADRLFDALLTFSRERESVGKINTGEFSGNAGRSMTTALVRSIGIVPQWGLARALENIQRRNVYEQMAEALTSPGGFNKLLEIARFDPTMARLDEYARALLAGNAYQEAQ